MCPAPLPLFRLSERVKNEKNPAKVMEKKKKREVQDLFLQKWAADESVFLLSRYSPTFFVVVVVVEL